MLSAGLALSSADRQSFLGLQGQASDKQAALETLRGQLEDLGREVSDENTNEYSARQRVEQARNLVDGIKRQIDEYQQQIGSGRRELEVLRGNVEKMYKLANFYWAEYQREFEADVVQAGLEAFFQSRNNYLEAVVAFHAAASKLAAAIAGVSSSVRGGYTPFSYLQPKQPQENKSREAFAQADSQRDNYNAQAENLRQKDADPFYQNKLGEAQAESSSANSDHAARQAAQKAAKKRYEDLRTEVQQAQAQLRDLDRQMREIQGKA